MDMPERPILSEEELDIEVTKLGSIINITKSCPLKEAVQCVNWGTSL